MAKRRWLLAALVSSTAACGLRPSSERAKSAAGLGDVALGPTGTASRERARGTAATSDPAKAHADGASRHADEATSEAAAAIAVALAQVSATRELAARGAVAGGEVSRREGIRLIVEKTKRDLPERVLAAQGEFFAALGLTPADYPFVEGVFAMVETNIAGFYDPDADRMYLVDDLDPGARRETLAHELVHALQDQHYDLGARLAYRPGELDRLAATSCLAEGDATSAMLDVAMGSAFRADAEQLRLGMMVSMALSTTGATTPRSLQLSLVAPYIDGFRFVQALRQRGGWAEVDRAWAAPPATTEQILHLEKYDAHEPALDVHEPESAALGEGWQRLDGDSAGEQGLRVAFEEWMTPSEAANAAAGWGGDRFVVFERASVGRKEFAVAWLVRFDDASEAREAERAVAKKLAACSLRPELGPLAWGRSEERLAFVAGPYRREPSKPARAAATCASASLWLSNVLRPPAPVTLR